MGTGAKEPWTLGEGEGKEALGAWGRGVGGGRIPASLSCPGLRRLPTLLPILETYLDRTRWG